MKKIINITLIVVVILSIFTLFINPEDTSAKSYNFKNVDVQITINKDGTFDLIEKRTFSFSGDFSWAKYELPIIGFDKLENFSISDENGPLKYDNITSSPSTYYLTESYGKYSCYFFYNASNTDKTFTIKYRIIGGIKAYKDVADMYWKLIGTGWDVRTEKLTALIRLPEEINIDELLVFGHGPIWGEVKKLNNREVSFEIKKIPAKTFIESRVVFPSSILNMNRIDKDILPAILKEEKVSANKANLKRILFKSVHYLFYIIPLIVLFFWFWCFYKYGKEHNQKVNFIYVREPPDNVPPSIVGFLLRFKKIKTEDYTATIMDLARRGYCKLSIKKETIGKIFKKDIEVLSIEKTDKEMNGLKPYEEIVYDFLFNKASTDGVTVSAEEIKKYIRTFSISFKNDFIKFKKLIEEDGLKKEYFEEKSDKVFGIFIIIGSILFFCGMLLPIYLSDSSALLLLFTSIFLMATSHVLRKRTKKGAYEYQEWIALKKYLLHFSNLKEAIPTSVIIWEKYLVYSVTFGIANTVIKKLKVVLPNLANQNDFMRSGLYGAAFMTGNFSQSMSTFTSSLNSFSQAVNSSMSSSTGSGGGFSGGGGGGGGGSGGGAG